MNAPVGFKARVRRPHTKTVVWALLFVLAAAGIVFLAVRPVGVVVATVAKTGLQPTIQGVGTVEAKVAVQLGARIGGRVVEVLVDQGDSVRVGQVLAKLDDSQLRAELQRAQAAVLVAQAQHKDARAGTRPEELAEAQALVARSAAQFEDLAAGARPPELEELRERVRAAKATRELNAITLARKKELFDKGAIPVQELDAAKQAAEVAAAQEKGAEQTLRLGEDGARKYQVKAAQAQVQASQRRLAFLRAGTRPAQIVAAQARVTEAEAALKLAQERLLDAVLTSPLDGYVVARLLEPGTVVNAGTPILKLADQRTAWVTVHVDERESASLAVGQEAAIALRSLRGKTLKGRVARIARETDRVTEQLALDVAFTEWPARIILGEQAEAAVRPPAHTDALTVPAGAVVRRPQGTGVLVLEEGRLRFRPANFGLADVAGRIEVQGVEAGTTVVVAPGALADVSADGKRARVLRSDVTP